MGQKKRIPKQTTYRPLTMVQFLMACMLHRVTVDAFKTIAIDDYARVIVGNDITDAAIGNKFAEAYQQGYIDSKSINADKDAEYSDSIQLTEEGAAYLHDCLLSVVPEV